MKICNPILSLLVLLLFVEGKFPPPVFRIRMHLQSFIPQTKYNFWMRLSLVDSKELGTISTYLRFVTLSLQVRVVWVTSEWVSPALCWGETPPPSTAAGTWSPGQVWTSSSTTPIIRCRDKVWAVKWYRGNFEIFRYIADERPPTKVFKLDHFDVDARRIYDQGKTYI